ncbi:MAG: phenylalanine--tRNA ligase subunit alpha [Candidatus Omnitrophota bacterium]
MLEELIKIREDFKRDLDSCKDASSINLLRSQLIGKKGRLSEAIKNIGSLPADERAKIGRCINELKEEIESEFCARIKTIEKESESQEAVDVTMPGVVSSIGHAHPLSIVLGEITDIFSCMGFEIIEGPEIEKEYYNFEALNIPLDHPSREAFDTFYIQGEYLLRSHTSPVQVRFMEEHKPPFRIIVPGRVFRPDATDVSHSFMFHQVEGLMVGDDVSFVDLKGILESFLKRLFGKNIRMRFRPHFFPFTEPSAEVDISCIICSGSGCRVCSHKGWLEILGAGMVNPKVFTYVKYDAEKYTGLAFGMGVERIAMLKYGIDDIRLFFENDFRFLRQF